MIPNCARRATPFRAKVISAQSVRLRLALSAVALAASCGGDGGGLVIRPVTPDPADALANLSVSPSLASLTVGQTAALTPTPTTAAAGVTVSYSYASSNTGIATVSAGGVVTGVAAGAATVTVMGTGVGVGFTTTQRTATANITVSAAALGVGFGPEQFANIPAGSYERGSTNGFSVEQPVRTISLNAFQMQKTEVSQGQWRQVMTGTALANPSYFTTCGDTCPVEWVSWNDIQQFLMRLNQQDPGKGYRLPTEAEWEYATRAGITGDYNVAGQPVEALGWIGTNSQTRTWPVAQKLPNAFGLFDTHGNVIEWVNDWFDPSYYVTSPASNPTGPTTEGSFRVLRGGSWGSVAIFARSANRFYQPPSEREYTFGFRLARTP